MPGGVVEALEALAGRRGRPMAQLALAWVLAQDVVTAPIVGASKVSHLEDALTALDLDLGADDIAVLEAPYRPQGIRGFS